LSLFPHERAVAAEYSAFIGISIETGFRFASGLDAWPGLGVRFSDEPDAWRGFGVHPVTVGARQGDGFAFETG